MPSLSYRWSNLGDLSDLDTDQSDRATVGDVLTINFTLPTGTVDVTGWTLAASISPDVDRAPVKTWTDSSFSGKTSGGAFVLTTTQAETQNLSPRNFYLQVRRVNSGFERVISKANLTLGASPSFVPVPTPGASGVPSTRILTIDGVSYDLSADRSWVTSGGAWGTITGTITDQADLVAYVAAHGGGGTWGSITGTITDQTDLVAYVAANSGSGNLDGGSPSSTYGGTTAIDGGTP